MQKPVVLYEQRAFLFYDIALIDVLLNILILLQSTIPMRQLYALLLFAIISTSSFAQTQLTVGSTTLDIDTIITGLNVPWEIVYGPDGKLWMTEREGIISRVDIQTGTKDVLLDIQSTVYAAGEAGMLGMTLHPSFPQQPYLYVAYTFGPSSNPFERMVRYTFDTDTLIDPVIYLDSMPAFSTHIGCRMIVGPDNRIYMTTGDTQNQPSAQDLNAITGKILRLELDGSVPNDNPIPGSYIYSWGHRNAQGLAFGPTGILYSSEHGPNTDDELNIIEPARNYGWPTVAGFCNTTTEIAFCADSNVIEPLWAWTPTIATSDLIYYDHPAIPEWQGKLLMTVLKNKQLIQLDLNGTEDSITTQTMFLTNQFGRLRDIVAGPDGTLYIATNGANWGNTDPGTHSIIRLKNNSFSSPLVVELIDTISQCGAGTISFTATVSGGTEPYRYEWRRFNTVLSDTTSTITITANANTNYTYYLEVTDANNNVIGDTITIVAEQEITEDVNSSTSFNVTLIDSAFGNGFQYIISTTEPGFDQIEVVWDDIYTMGTQVYDGDSIVVTDEFVICTLGTNPSCGNDFTICAIDLDNCRKVCSDSTYLFIVTGIEPQQQLEAIQLYPNPAQNKLYLQNIKEDIQLSIFNLQGKTILQKELDANSNFELDLSELASGMYLVKMRSENGERTTKLLVD